MAHVIASVTFYDGQTIQVRSSGAASYPDALAQLRHEAVEGVRELMGVVREEAAEVEAEDE